MNERYAYLARNLADALMNLARSREDRDRKWVAQLHTELCALRREETKAIVTEEPAQ